MAQAEISAPQGTSATSIPSPSYSQNSILPITDATPNSTDISTIQLSSIPLPTIDAPVESDDEVQFIFSAPRRRKKKRRRIESSHISTKELQEVRGKTEGQTFATPSEPPRRGTTGMVQRLESCHLGDVNFAAKPRTGSLPLVPPTLNANPKPRSATFVPSNQSMASSQFLSFAPFMSVPWWADPSLHLQDIPMAQNESTLMQQEDKTSNKRKREGNPEQPTPSPVQCARAEGSNLQAGNIAKVGEMDIEPLDIFANSTTTTNSNNVAFPISTIQSFSWNTYSNLTESHSRSATPTHPAKKPKVTESAFRPSQQASIQSPDPVRTFQNGVPQKQTVTVPARLVLEQSVSPRTQTVEIPRPPLANQVEARQLMLLKRGMISNRQPVPSQQNPRTMMPMSRNNQFRIPRSVPPQALFSVGSRRPQQNELLNRPQNLQTYSPDIVRKPSLYKIPPWPLSPSPAGPNQSSSSAMRHRTSNTTAVDSMLGMNSSVSSEAGGIPNLHRRNMMRTRVAAVQGITNSFSAQRMMPVIPSRTPPLQSQAQSSPIRSPPPTHSQENPNKRKHSPNLIVDIAETCQSNFPFAAIAERHQTPIQKVFDTFSAIIQLPLLRSASDNRRHGSLGKRRMKEFRDAKKAMEKEIKDKIGDPAPSPGRRKNAKKGPEQPLLRAAILNNASRGKERGS